MALAGSLEEALAPVDAGLASVIRSIADSVADISSALRTMEFDEAGSTNSFGDDQLQADLQADDIIFKHLRNCPAVESASSEEQSDIIPTGGRGYTVAFDPLDGSSIFGANFAEGTWQLRQVHTKMGNRNNVAPANIKAAADNIAYRDLLNSWIVNGCKLRYSGGMVPDVHHILAKGGGVFCNPVSTSAPAKLRLLYECAPFALVVEAAGGISHNGNSSVLDLPLEDTGSRSKLALGSKAQVMQCLEALRSM
eukprot:gene12568-12700_t